jgi:diguanylate cyclase (GGDEF)-like protein
MSQEAEEETGRPQPAPGGWPRASEDAGNLLRVLLVDNDREAVARSEAALRRRLRERVAVRIAASLGEAIAMASRDIPDVIVLDPGVGPMDPVATLASMRAVAPTVPVVVQARTLDDSLALQLLRAGAQECLGKGAEAEGLARSLGFALERQRRLAALDAERLQAAHRATHDPLTGLANRALFFDHLERALAYGGRHGTKTGVLYVDLDGFKGVNDRLGHAVGDGVLREVAQRLMECVRRSDLVARLGGDEFVVLLPDVLSRLDVARVRSAVLDRMAVPLALPGVAEPLGVGASVGEAMAPLDGTTALGLLEVADGAMYRAKGAHRRTGRVAVAPTWEAALREAVPRGEILAHYQPIMAFPSGRLVSVEALARWRHPAHGVLSPAAFLQLAEDTGLVVPLGLEVLRQACREVVALRRHPALEALTLHANISGVQLREPTCARAVAAVLADTGCPAEALTLEVTETSALVEGTAALATMAALQAQGVHLVLDDFGVGHGSLQLLREAPVSGLKVDRRFVQRMLDDRRDWAIVTALLKLARGLGAEVVAEGVERPAQAHALARLGCQRQQGFLFARPMGAEALRSWAVPEAA